MEITIETTVNASIEKVWAIWTKPEHIVQWNFASADWRCPRAELDLAVGGRFNYRMESRDGSMGFDFKGTFTRIEPNRKIEYALEDDRKVSVNFLESTGGTSVLETFEAENKLSGEQQRQGWQAILNNFKSYVESSST